MESGPPLNLTTSQKMEGTSDKIENTSANTENTSEKIGGTSNKIENVSNKTGSITLSGGSKKLQMNCKQVSIPNIKSRIVKTAEFQNIEETLSKKENPAAEKDQSTTDSASSNGTSNDVTPQGSISDPLNSEPDAMKKLQGKKKILKKEDDLSQCSVVYRLNCEHCSESFERITQLRLHMKLNHSKGKVSTYNIFSHIFFQWQADTAVTWLIYPVHS